MNNHGGVRPGAGRPLTGRRSRSFSVTEDEYYNLVYVLKQIRFGYFPDNWVKKEDK